MFRQTASFSSFPMRNRRSREKNVPSTTESPRRNILGMKRSLLIGLRFLLLGWRTLQKNDWSAFQTQSGARMGKGPERRCDYLQSLSTSICVHSRRDASKRQAIIVSSKGQRWWRDWREASTYLFDILQDHIAVSVKGLDSRQELVVVAKTDEDLGMVSYGRLQNGEWALCDEELFLGTDLRLVQLRIGRVDEFRHSLQLAFQSVPLSSSSLLLLLSSSFVTREGVGGRDAVAEKKVQILKPTWFKIGPICACSSQLLHFFSSRKVIVATFRLSDSRGIERERERDTHTTTGLSKHGESGLEGCGAGAHDLSDFQGQRTCSTCPGLLPGSRRCFVVDWRLAPCLARLDARCAR